MQLHLSNQVEVELQTWVSMRLRHELQQIYWQGTVVGASSADEAPPTLTGDKLLQAQDHAVRSLVTKLTVDQHVFTEPAAIFEQIMNLPSSDGEKIYVAVNKIITESNQTVPKVSLDN